MYNIKTILEDILEKSILEKRKINPGGCCIERYTEKINNLSKILIV